ncbi:DinB family protein, partial [Glutamicibacter ardleyensis]|uniref:DinB family protein n=1 Tax=Glutamicibacter ardleyensis TaxID=225894 RepID=UPI003FD0875C
YRTVTGVLRHHSAYLNEARSTVLWKCEALSEELARRPMTPTGTHMLGIVHHLAVTEYGYFGECLGLLPNDDHVLELLQSEDSQIDFLPPADYSVQDVLELYRKSVAFAEAALDNLELASPAVIPWWSIHRHSTVEHLIVHMIAETSRHAGQLDIVRELLDGQVGLREQALNLPSYSSAQWQEQYSHLQQLSQEVVQRK